MSRGTAFVVGFMGFLLLFAPASGIIQALLEPRGAANLADVLGFVTALLGALLIAALGWYAIGPLRWRFDPRRSAIQAVI